MRIEYSDDEEWTGQFALWQANCDRSIRGRVGQRVLKILEAALVEMEDKRLIAEAFASDDGICASGVLVLKLRTLRGESSEEILEDLKAVDVNDSHATTKLAKAVGIPRLVNWQLVAQNDEVLGSVTPEERYTRILAWVREQIR